MARAGPKDIRGAGSEVEAQVVGSGPQPYRVRLSLEPPFGSSCDCPYDGGGARKHVVAVGLAWLRAQEAGGIREEPAAPSLMERLGELDAGRLRELLVEVYDEVADARSVIDRRLLREGLWMAGDQPGAVGHSALMARVGARLDDPLEIFFNTLDQWAIRGLSELISPSFKVAKSREGFRWENR